VLLEDKDQQDLLDILDLLVQQDPQVSRASLAAAVILETQVACMSVFLHTENTQLYFFLLI